MCRFHIENEKGEKSPGNVKDDVEKSEKIISTTKTTNSPLGQLVFKLR